MQSSKFYRTTLKYPTFSCSHTRRAHLRQLQIMHVLSVRGPSRKGVVSSWFFVLNFVFACVSLLSLSFGLFLDKFCCKPPSFLVTPAAPSKTLTFPVWKTRTKCLDVELGSLKVALFVFNNVIPCRMKISCTVFVIFWYCSGFSQACPEGTRFCCGTCRQLPYRFVVTYYLQAKFRLFTLSTARTST